MSTDELQIEEIEVLDSIYDGDELFKKLNPTTYQYMVMHPTNEHKNFLLEVAWGKTYPDEPPEINLDAFYNKHITVNVKNGIRETILNQVEDLIGCAMTYTLFEYAKENVVTLTSDQPDQPEPTHEDVISTAKNEDRKSAEKETKSKMTKAQKRRMWDKAEGGAKGGEKPRGWDWADIIRHLSQTGGKEDSPP